MHQTTVRFGADLWSAVEQEAAALGVSTAQYVRDAALARLAFTRGVEHGRDEESVSWLDLAAVEEQPESSLTTAARRSAEHARAQLTSSEAVRAQGRLARDRAKRLRAEADNLRHTSATHKRTARGG
jgi:hypothetical protein